MKLVRLLYVGGIPIARNMSLAPVEPDVFAICSILSSGQLPIMLAIVGRDMSTPLKRFTHLQWRQYFCRILFVRALTLIPCLSASIRKVSSHSSSILNENPIVFLFWIAHQLL